MAVATIAPLADLLARVAGAGWEVRSIVPAGTSPHVFEPRPESVRLLAPARLVVAVGAGYDGWVMRLAAASASRAVIHDAGSTVGVRLGGEPGPAHDEEETDPHWWLSPVLAAAALPPLAQRLAALDRAGAAGYESRARSAQADLMCLDAEIKERLAPVRGAPLLTSHNAWSYFAARYGLHVVGAIEPVPGREPSPAELRGLIDGARRYRVRALFTEPQFPLSSARVVARDAGVRLLTVDPIGGVPGLKTYDQLLRFDAAVFRQGLEGT